MTAPDIDLDALEAAFVESQFKRVAAERDALAASIRDAAVKAGICRNDAPLTGPMLVMLCGNMVDSIVSLAAEMKALRARAIELEAETKSSEEMQTLKFCEREWSTERAAMMNTIHALRNCGDAHPVHARELTDETIQRHWDEACKDTTQTPGWSRHIRFARAIERYLKGVSENG